MPSPPRPPHLSNHHRNTLRQILQHPAGHDIEWRVVLPLLGAAGSAEEQPGGEVAETIGSQTEDFDPPRPKDIGTQAVVNLRPRSSSPPSSPSPAFTSGAGRSGDTSDLLGRVRQLAGT